ncbi:hypothetical protein [Methylotenera sp.]|uniref:hypothetical protein n=1 Tax=Methylotenera sp. TaxID=2051956 RepID=UPI002487E024|nr:hypothetical protein [Methylotenera sp.]MDI1362531.1 hypothetical protein [Methylotenera sp.]
MAKKLIHTETNLDAKRMVKVYDDSQWGEYVCELYELKLVPIGGGVCSRQWVKYDEASYHTCSRTQSDRDDAIGTAVMMCKPLKTQLEPDPVFNLQYDNVINKE